MNKRARRTGLSVCKNCGHQLEYAIRYGRWMHYRGGMLCEHPLTTADNHGIILVMCGCEEPETSEVNG